MSASANTVTVGARFAHTSPGESHELSDSARYRIRLMTFAALALYGAIRWGTLMRPAPTWRLMGLAALAIAIAAGVPPLRRYGRVAPLALTVVACLFALPVAGLRWHSFAHVRIAVSARYLGRGLSALPNSLVPYIGSNHAIMFVIALGAAVLLIDAAIVIAFAPPQFGDARRAGAAVPLIALAIVPATLVRPELPYLQGLILFALLAAFLWGERVRRDAAVTALCVAAVAGTGAAIVAPRIDQHKPLLNYRAWAGTLASGRIDAFDWNQTYGPLHWPHSGHEVLTVTARTPDYWKAENLDMFNGTAWVLGSPPGEPALPRPSAAALAAWTQRIRVTIDGMRTNEVIASGEAQRPSQLFDGVQPGSDPGRWISEQPLGPGTSYEVTTYSPHPSAAQLRDAGSDYPYQALSDYLTLTIPGKGFPAPEYTQVTFGPFRGSRAPSVASSQALSAEPNIAAVMSDSPYAGAYALAQRLADRSPTPYAFVSSVLRYLSHGYTYDQNPPRSTYPLVNFLFYKKLGYCQQFSGAMALLLRMGGLPVRVAAGFTSGTQDGNRWLVSDIDAHAWVEVWFPHYGWVRFDPTPTVAPARGGGVTKPILKNLPGASLNASGAPGAHAKAKPSVSSSAQHSSGGGPGPLLIVPAVALVIALAWLLRGLLRPVPSTDELLDELECAMTRTGRPLGAGVTLAALEHRFRGAPAAAGYIRSLRLMRYSGSQAGPVRGGRRALREELRRDLGLSGRLRALWALPPRPVAGLGRRAGALKS